MDREEIIRMAREAGLAPYHPALGLRDDQQTALERFAKLVAAKEREACARECEAVPVRAGYSGMQKFAWEAGTSDCAEAIRARKEA